MKARRLLDEIGSPWLKVVIDPGEPVPPGEMRPFAEMLREAFDWLGPDIVLAHAKNPALWMSDADDARIGCGDFGEHARAQYAMCIRRGREHGVDRGHSANLPIRASCPASCVFISHTSPA